MTRRHFDVLAGIVRDLPVDAITRGTVARALVGYCAAFYRGRFAYDPNRFLAACGVDTEE